MCGLNGIFAYAATAPAPSPDEAQRVRDAMTVRGPDGAGLWTSDDKRCVLGHRRLSILDLSDRALQPMATDDRRYTIIYNGEIYNYPELRQEALALGRALHTTSDTEILLDLFAREGAAMVGRLRGMFALAIWDAATGSLFLARDPFGIKPLFFADDGGSIRFASQVRALRRGGGISAAVDPAGLVGFALLGSVPEPFTWFRDVQALPAGHCMTVDARGVRPPRRFFDPAETLAELRAPDVPLAEARRQGREAIRASIRAHLLADVPVGLFLSGGIDSAAILGVAAEYGCAPIRTITLGFDEFAGTIEDEVPIATRIAAYYGADHRVRRIGREEFLGDLEAILDAMDQPSIDGVNTWFVAKAAHEQGLKVALSGIGGDEMLGGYPSFADVPAWHTRYGALARRPGLAGALSHGLRLLAPGFLARNPKAIGLLRHSGTLGGAYMVRRSLRLPDEALAMFDPDVVDEGLKRLALDHRFDDALDPAPADGRAAVTLLELSFYMRNQLLRDADWAAMHHSIEVRTPMVDATLFRALAPLIGRLAPGEGKQLLADVPDKPLPDWHRRRGKTGFSIPYAAWMAGIADAAVDGQAAASKGHTSRAWSLYLLERMRQAA